MFVHDNNIFKLNVEQREHFILISSAYKSNEIVCIYSNITLSLKRNKAMKNNKEKCELWRLGVLNFFL